MDDDRRARQAAYMREYRTRPGNRERINARVRERKRAWRRDHPDEYRAQARAEYHRYKPAKHRANRNSYLKRKYGLSTAEYEALLAEQDGACAICRRPERWSPPGGAPIRLAVDHDHATGKIRGLLCRDCNRTLGRFNDDPALFDAAAAYLRR